MTDGGKRRFQFSDGPMIYFFEPVAPTQDR
jgi:hypothetical protein